jgi:hypothetical protein
MLNDDSYYVPDEPESGCTKGLFDAVIKIVKAAENVILASTMKMDGTTLSIYHFLPQRWRISSQRSIS